MKLVYCLLFGFFFNLKVYSQNCKKLDESSFFTTIKFGGKIPSELTTNAKALLTRTSYYIDFLMKYDSLSKDYKMKYSNLFTFLSVPFAFSEITENRREQIYSFDLYSFFEDNHSGDSITFKTPDKFNKLYKKLQSLYGKPSRIEEPSNFDSLFIRERGMPMVFGWECNEIRLQLSVRYGARDKWRNSIHILIRSMIYETPEAEKAAFSHNLINSNSPRVTFQKKLILQ